MSYFASTFYFQNNVQLCFLNNISFCTTFYFQNNVQLCFLNNILFCFLQSVRYCFPRERPLLLPKLHPRQHHICIHFCYHFSIPFFTTFQRQVLQPMLLLDLEHSGLPFQLMFFFLISTTLDLLFNTYNHIQLCAIIFIISNYYNYSLILILLIYHLLHSYEIT